jgi:hypothetical protein
MGDGRNRIGTEPKRSPSSVKRRLIAEKRRDELDQVMHIFKQTGEPAKQHSEAVRIHRIEVVREELMVSQLHRRVTREEQNRALWSEYQRILTEKNGLIRHMPVSCFYCINEDCLNEIRRRAGIIDPDISPGVGLEITIRLALGYNKNNTIGELEAMRQARKGTEALAFRYKDIKADYNNKFCQMHPEGNRSSAKISDLISPDSSFSSCRR